MKEKFCEVYYKVIELIQKDGIKTINDCPNKTYERKLGNWIIAMHGNKNNQIIKPKDCMDIEAEYGKIYLWWNGWIAGTISPFEGIIINHPEGCNEKRLIEDINKEF